MKRPLYRLTAEPRFDFALSHTGLWFDKFCNQWCRDSQKTELAAWSLKAFSEGQGKDRRDINPKLDWIHTVTRPATAKHPVGDPQLITEHATRLANLARALGGQALVFKTTSRLATGLGREHPIENGFAWHPVLGTPYLPGSSVKGLVRAWLEGAWSDQSVEPADFHRIFGSDYRQGSAQHERKQALSSQISSVLFLDALPTKPVQLKADVMTPHYGDYYQAKKDPDGNPIPPADWLSPNPIPFLTVAHDQLFQFALAPRTASAPDQADCSAATQWLEAALTWLGAGAKTAVGYGRFTRDTAAEAKLEADRQAAQQRANEERIASEKKASLEARLATLSPLAQKLEQTALAKNWDTDKNAFAAQSVIEDWLSRLEAEPERDAIARLRQLVDHHFPGLLANPDKTEGKKAKPAFKERQRLFAKRLNALLTRTT
jgi:CRISPR-associated protein Cmr6